MKKQISKETLEKIKKELNYLKTVTRKEIAERLKEAISFGDLRENAAYHEAKESQGFLEGKIIELENLIRNSIIVNLEKSNKIVVGSKIKVLSDEGEEEYIIVSPIESDPFNGKISEDSLIGKNFIGKEKGDICEIIAPTGDKISYKIIDIS